ncbi:DUF4328 domain-containing protein [Streptomyces tsukubensis]|uniref:DUF4328 domain-containing protein n=1 Tax=Streptomyces tsukubensis (strain DSM 42081 / NBRC 108919 / NRRL 18488 / 9993) TaxID=1114943 RepID=A0A7G3UFN5_STRT9|nr:DUF4328 domain-containing protein [Streptomyces tsukubensis]QKM67900.1 hypothetical protein STSU_012675 [Streptomyces tsukubensis NRRL18488]TAI44295.1 DUF4328 domain-containing protein [Streptomyces tsukubensis]
MTLCSNCRRNTAATAQHRCEQCAAAAAVAGQPAAAARGDGAAPASAPLARPVKVPRALAYAVIVLLCIGVFVDLFAIRSSLLMWEAADGFRNAPLSVTEADADHADAVMAVAILLKGLALLGTGILFIVWFAAARGTAALLEPRLTRWGRGWAVGGWFIPLAGLVIPRLVAGAIWEASRRNPDEAGGAQRSTILTLWWILFVFGLLTWQVSFQRYREAWTIDEVASGAGWLLAAGIINIAAAVLAIVVVRKITSMQSEKAAAAVRDQYSPLPPWPPLSRNR